MSKFKTVKEKGTPLSIKQQQQIETLWEDFLRKVNKKVENDKINKRFIRILSNNNLTFINTFENIFAVIDEDSSNSEKKYVNIPEKRYELKQMGDIIKWDYDFKDPAIISFPKIIFSGSRDKKRNFLINMADAYLQSESYRIIKMEDLIQVNPLFGQFPEINNRKLVFVAMPYDDGLTQIYNEIIKPTVEKNNEFSCKRADDLKTNAMVIQDIWQSICQSQIIIADITGFNSNVMYELGIAHTIGKETILINQVNQEESIKFPFDISHIRRIQYNNDTEGLIKLKEDLSQTIENINK